MPIYICLTTTYFSFEGQYYQQNDEVAMGSPLLSTVTNIFLEHLEKIAMQTANKSTINVASICGWHFLIMALWTGRAQSVSEAHQQLTTIHPVYHGGRRWRKDLLSWCTWLWRTMEVYCKPTHTDRNYQLYHPHHIKTGIIRTLMRWCKQICNTAEAADHEWHHLIHVFTVK